MSFLWSVSSFADRTDVEERRGEKRRPWSSLWVIENTYCNTTNSEKISYICLLNVHHSQEERTLKNIQFILLIFFLGFVEREIFLWFPSEGRIFLLVVNLMQNNNSRVADGNLIIAWSCPLLLSYCNFNLISSMIFILM